MGFSRQEYWSGLPCPSPGDLPDPGLEPVFSVSPALQAHSLPTETQGIYHSLFIYSPMEEHQDGLKFGVIMNRYSENIYIFIDTYFHFSWVNI